MMDKLADSPNLSPHTEESPLNAPPFLKDRADYAIKTFENTDIFDTIVLRPTNVYGLSSSYYGDFFRLAAEAKEKGVWEISEKPKTILHALHVDDCGEVYEQLASYPDRGKVQGKCYNISNYRFETLEEITQALVKEYQISGGVKFLPVDPHAGSPDVNMTRFLLGFSQWTGSERLRKDVGWKDRRSLFSRALPQYRLAYEAAMASGDSEFEFWKKK
jgi:nucleoside-diphosphate-sugar epimerase